MITPKMIRQMKHELSSEKPTVRVGKNGTTEQVINEVSRQLEQRELVKIKILKSALRDTEAKNVASEIVQQTGAKLIEVRGHTAILYKRRKKGEKSL